MVQKIITTIIVASAVVLLGLFLTGCTATKEVSKSIETVDSTYTKKLEQTIASLESSIANYEAQIREMQYSTVSADKKCDTVINNVIKQIINSGCPKERVDSFLNSMKELRTKIKVLTDGSIEAEGYLNAVTVSKEKLQHMTSRLVVENFKLQENLDEVTAQLVKEKTKKDKVEKITLFPWYFWLITGGIALLWLNAQFKPLSGLSNIKFFGTNN